MPALILGMHLITAAPNTLWPWWHTAWVVSGRISFSTASKHRRTNLVALYMCACAATATRAPTATDREGEGEDAHVDECRERLLRVDW